MQVIKNQLSTIMCKPAVRLKILLITLLFIPTLIEQSGIIAGYAENIGYKGQVTVAIMLLHTFNYLYFYVDVLLVGFILLIPDIVRDEYVERQSIILSYSRKKAAGNALARIVCFSVLYMIWFVFLTIIITGMWYHNFSFEWPRFISVIQKQVPDDAIMYMQLIMLPKNCMDYPVIGVLFMVLLRSALGFIFLGLLAGLVTLMTKKTKFGVGIVIFLLAYALFIYYDLNGGFLCCFNASLPVVTGEARIVVDIIKTTIVPFFTFRSMTDDFTYWIRYGIFSGLVWCIIAGIGVWIYYQKGDLGDADQDE